MMNVLSPEDRRSAPEGSFQSKNEIARLELRVIAEQIRNLNLSIAELEKTIGEEGSKRAGHQSLSSIKGIGKIKNKWVFEDFPNFVLAERDQARDRACRLERLV
jgi:hypothetical protein